MSQVTRANSKLKFQSGDVPTQADFEDLHDSVRWYNEAPYGILWAEDNGVATGNTAAANTTAMNTFLALCETQNKIAGIGSGTFNFAGVITKPANVDLIGAGAGRTIFKSTTANTLLTTSEGFDVYTNNVPEVRRNGNVAGIEFNGNSIGTIGFHVYKQVNVYFTDVSTTGFTQKGIYSNASIYIEWRNCRTMFSPVGFSCDGGSGGSLPGGVIMGNNTIKFYNCDFWECSSWGVDWERGAQGVFYGCVIERCGTEGNVNTGGARFQNVSTGNEGVAISFDNMWMEANSGTNVYITGTGITTYIVRNSIFQFDGGFSHTSMKGFYVGGANTTLKIADTTIQVTGTDIEVNAAKVILDNVRYGSYSVASGGTVYEIQPTLISSGGGDTTAPTLSSAVVNNATPTQIELTYNEALNTSSVPATSDFTVSGGKTVSSVGVSGSKVTVTVNSAYANGDTITISYIQGTNRIEDVAGNDAAALSSQAVTNNVGSAAPTSGLLMLHHFEETTGNFLDSSGNSKDFTLLNSVSYTPSGKIGHAVEFIGTSSHRIQSPTGTGLSAGTGFTIVFWANIANAAATQTVLQKGTNGTSNSEYGIFIAGGNISFFTTRSGVNATYQEVTKAVTTGWHFIVATWDGSNITISVDNGTAATAAQAGMHTNTSSLYVGGEAGSGGTYFTGYIDLLRIYNRALSSGEQTTLYNGGTGI